MNSNLFKLAVKSISVSFIATIFLTLSVIDYVNPNREDHIITPLFFAFWFLSFILVIIFLLMGKPKTNLIKIPIFLVSLGIFNYISFITHWLYHIFGFFYPDYSDINPSAGLTYLAFYIVYTIIILILSIISLAVNLHKIKKQKHNQHTQ